MKHIKTVQSQTYQTRKGIVTIEGPLSSNNLRKYEFHEQLSAFRPSINQFEAILSIADISEGRMIIARNEDTIIGYVTFLYPDPSERWAFFNMNNLIVLGAIEVVPEYRNMKIASNLLKVSMMDSFMENYIIISTEYYWHWDLKGTKLGMWEYRKVMEKMMASGGLTPTTTDDPEIISHTINCLMVRIGKNVSEDSIEQFNKLRFLQRYKNKSSQEGC